MERGNGKGLFSGYRFSFGADENVLELDRVVHNIVNVLNVTGLYTLTWLKW